MRAWLALRSWAFVSDVLATTPAELLANAASDTTRLIEANLC